MSVVPVGDYLILNYLDEDVKVILINGDVVSGVLKKSEFCNRLWIGERHIFIDKINEIYLA